MKKVLLFVIIILCLLPVLTQASEELSQEQVLLSILNELNGDFIEEDISANGMIKEGFLDVNELDKIGQEVINYIEILGIEKDINFGTPNEAYYVKEEISDDGYNQVSYFGYDNNRNQLTIILSSYINIDENGETYLYININKREIFVENNVIMDRVKNLFSSFNSNVEITTCILGEFNGKFSENDIKNTINTIQNLSGRIVDEYNDSNLVSLTAYTEYIDDNILAGEDRINLNVALRYSEYDNKTIIWIGTPIIASGY